MPKPRWSIEQKKQHVAAWRASGLTRQQYCELNDIPFTNGRRTLQKLNGVPANPPFFLFMLQALYHQPGHFRLSRTSRSLSSCPAGYVCAAILRN